jgi:hypothetical protein
MAYDGEKVRALANSLALRPGVGATFVALQQNRDLAQDAVPDKYDKGQHLMPSDDTEIARQQGTEFRSVHLERQADGAIRMHAYDKGPAAERFSGRDEYEFWVTVPEAEVAKLALVLLREKFGGRLQAVTEFRDFCKQHEIANAFDVLN